MVTLLTPQDRQIFTANLPKTDTFWGGGVSMPLGDVGVSMPLGQTLEIIHGGIPLLNGIAHLDQFQLTFTLAMLCGIKAKPGHVHLLLC